MSVTENQISEPHRASTAAGASAATLPRPEAQPNPAASSKPANKQLEALTVIRFLASAVIVLHHSVDTFKLSPEFEKLNPTLCLTFFYVLSGFILTYVYPKVTTRAEVFKFWRARVARCWPLHLLTFAWFAFVIRLGLGWDENGWPVPSIAIANIFLVQSWLPVQRLFFSFNAPSWSVSVELFFYLLFPFLQLWRGRGASLGKLIFVLVAACAMAIGSSFAASKVTDPDLHLWLSYVNPTCRLFEFVAGIAIAYLYVRTDHLNSPAKATALQLIAVAAWLGFCIKMPQVFAFFGTNFPPQVLFGVVCSMIIFSLALDKGFVSRLCSNKVAVKLGDMSYAIYLLHSPLSHACRPYWEQMVKDTGNGAFALYATILLVLSFVVHQYFELPLRNRIVGKRKAYK